MKIPKKFWVYIIISGIVMYFSLAVVNKERERIKKFITCYQNSNVIEEKEITHRFYYLPISLILETTKKLELELKRKFWKEYFLENFRWKLLIFPNAVEIFLKKFFKNFDIVSSLEGSISFLNKVPVNFYVEGEYLIPFLKKTKVYKVIIIPEGVFICPPKPRTLIIGVQNGDKIFNLNNLKEFNKLIKEEKIWLASCSKAIKYATLLIELISDCWIKIINLTLIEDPLEEFIKEFIIGPYPGGGHDLDEHGKWVFYTTVQEYRRSFPKKYQELSKYKNKIKESPQVIKETKYNYEIILHACEISRGELALTELKVTVYKTGEINFKKKYLIKGIKN